MLRSLILLSAILFGGEAAFAQPQFRERNAIGMIEINITDPGNIVVETERGSGVIISSDGHVLSAGHIFSEENFKICTAASDARPGFGCRINYFLRGSANRNYRLRIVSPRSTTQDYVVLKLPNASDVIDVRDWPSVFIGDMPRTGTPLFASGYPGEIRPDVGGGNPLAVIAGTLSVTTMSPCAEGEGWGLSRVMTGATSPGQSGGPVFDGRNRLVAIVIGRTCPTDLQGAEETRILPVSDIRDLCERYGCKKGFPGYIAPYDGTNGLSWQSRLEGGPEMAGKYIYDWKLSGISRLSPPNALCMTLTPAAAEKLKTDSEHGGELATVYRFSCMANQLGDQYDAVQDRFFELADRGYEPAQFSAAFILMQQLQLVIPGPVGPLALENEAQEKLDRASRYLKESADHGWGASAYLWAFNCRVGIVPCDDPAAALEAAAALGQPTARFELATLLLLGDTDRVREAFGVSFEQDEPRALALLRKNAQPEPAVSSNGYQLFDNQSAGLLAYLYGGGTVNGNQLVTPNRNQALTYELSCFGGMFNLANPAHLRCALFGHIGLFNSAQSAAQRAQARDLLKGLSGTGGAEALAAENILTWFEGGSSPNRITCNLGKMLDLSPPATPSMREAGSAYCDAPRPS